MKNVDFAENYIKNIQNCKACFDYLNASHIFFLIYLASEGQFNEGIIIQELKCSFYFSLNGYEYNTSKKKRNIIQIVRLLYWFEIAGGWGCGVSTNKQKSFEYYLTFF